MNKPVAWAIKVGKDLIEIVDEIRDFQELVDFYKLEQWDFEEVSLYTHPADLTDEEINDIAQECWVYPKGEQAIFNQHKFARAILRKASEK